MPKTAIFHIGGAQYTMNLHINGEARRMDVGTVAELILLLGLEGRMIAIERNMEIVPKSGYADTHLQDDDRIEIVHMIGGG